jgi:hypothetical protein
MGDQEIGNELYWRFALFENSLRHNIDKELTRCFGNAWINDVVKFDKSKMQLSLADIDMLEHYDINEVQFTGIINDLSLEDEYYRAKSQKNKISLGLWVKIIENWRKIEDVHTINDNGLSWSELKFVFAGVPKIKPPFTIDLQHRNHWHITKIEKISNDILFPERSGFYINDYRIELLDACSEIYSSIVTELKEIQKLRNDFCHFRFAPEKLDIAIKLLDKNIVYLNKKK